VGHYLQHAIVKLRQKAPVDRYVSELQEVKRHADKRGIKHTCNAQDEIAYDDEHAVSTAARDSQGVEHGRDDGEEYDRSRYRIEEPQPHVIGRFKQHLSDGVLHVKWHKEVTKDTHDHADGNGKQNPKHRAHPRAWYSEVQNVSRAVIAILGIQAHGYAQSAVPVSHVLVCGAQGIEWMAIHLDGELGMTHVAKSRIKSYLKDFAGVEMGAHAYEDVFHQQTHTHTALSLDPCLLAHISEPLGKAVDVLRAKVKGPSLHAHAHGSASPPAK
jgi:hypothetical protein